jgi:hypothetical protein
LPEDGYVLLRVPDDGQSSVIVIYIFNVLAVCVMAQAVSRRPLNAEARIHARVSLVQRFPNFSVPRIPNKSFRLQGTYEKLNVVILRVKNNELKYIVLKLMLWQKRPNYLPSYHVNYEYKKYGITDIFP